MNSVFPKTHILNGGGFAHVPKDVKELTTIVNDLRTRLAKSEKEVSQLRSAVEEGVSTGAIRTIVQEIIQESDVPSHSHSELAYPGTNNAAITVDPDGGLIHKNIWKTNVVDGNQEVRFDANLGIGPRSWSEPYTKYYPNLNGS